MIPLGISIKPKVKNITKLKVVKTAAPVNVMAVSYTHLRAHETKANLVCRLLLEKKK